jgi:hypothetical protein
MGRGSKATTNENKHPYVVELSVARDGLDVERGRRIIQFHKTRLFNRNMDVELLPGEANFIIGGAFPIY